VGFHNAFSQVRHVVWDWNGTLLDDTPVTVGAVNAALAAVGLPIRVTLEQWREITTRPVDATYRTLLGRQPTSAEWDIITRVWLEAYEAADPPLAGDALASLNTFAQRGLGQSVVSLHVTDLLLPRMVALGVRDFFSKVSAATSSEGAGGIRTKAELLAGHLEELGQEPSGALVIGDMADDAEAAHAVGAQSILVATGDTSRRRLEASGFPVAGSLSEALTWLD
jgi:phosphoglycolate phosphatase-like HAD superfamily hydrolase